MIKFTLSSVSEAIWNTFFTSCSWLIILHQLVDQILVSPGVDIWINYSDDDKKAKGSDDTYILLIE